MDRERYSLRELEKIKMAWPGLKYQIEPSGSHEAVEGRAGQARELDDGGLGNLSLFNLYMVRHQVDRGQKKANPRGLQETR